MFVSYYMNMLIVYITITSRISENKCSCIIPDLQKLHKLYV